MTYDTILFDLDGTLADTGMGITNSVAYALGRLGISVGSREELYKFIGPPLMNSFQDFYGLSEEQAEQGVKYYRERYREQGVYECYVYAGMEELLNRLQEAGRTLAVATSKPEPFAVTVLEHVRLASYFTVIAGSATDNKTRITKAEVIEYALASCGITDRSGVVIVGDRKHDVIGAKAAGIDSIGVLFGYGDRKELEEAGATHIAEGVEDIYPIIMG